VSFSVNLTDGRSRPLDDTEVAWFSAPLIITGKLVILEVVFWSQPYQRWIHLVRDHTERIFNPDHPALEVTVDEMPHYEQHLRKIGL
jgi:hypothetical protein